MKQGTMYHPKTLDLQARLGIHRYEACGILECLWQWTAQYCPEGDVGRYPDHMIAEGIGWPKDDAERLVQALVESRWLDAHDMRRLIVHDWPHHSTDGVHLFLARRTLLFADGTRPNLTRLSKAERRKITTAYKQNSDMRTKSASNAHKKRFPSAEMRTTTTTTTAPTTAYTNKTRGGSGGNGDPAAVGEIAGNLVCCFQPNSEQGNPDDTLGYWKARITDATHGEFHWNGAHVRKLEAVLLNPRGEALLHERIVEPLTNSEAASIEAPGRFANARLCETAEELGVNTCQS